jgi:4-hydroxy-tetrahydrodipicolinate reductase
MARFGKDAQRKKGEIGFATLRGGDVIGDHSVIFAGDGERIELTHKAGSRDVFAKGAIRAAIWGTAKTPGFYSMRDVLN